MPGRGAQPVYGYSGHGHFTPLLGDAGRCHGPPDRRVVFGAGIPCKLSLRSRTPRALPFPMAGCHLRVQLGTAGPGGDRSHPNRLGRLGWPSPDFMEHKGDSNQFEPCSCPSRRTGVAGNKVQSAQSINDACLSAGGPGCKLCPTDWQLRGDKCYWFSRGRNTWNASRVDCSARGSQLLVIRDREELVKGMIPSCWSCPCRAGPWGQSPRAHRLHGRGPSPLSRRFPVSGRGEWNHCGELWGNRISSESCRSVRQWICQRDAVPL
uniref:C-type lectin domain-containing protein n=1 Tax=Chrysemys picta bellii TaxID=8478 RepID=A0A8C3I1J6_CHRPI